MTGEEKAEVRTRKEYCDKCFNNLCKRNMNDKCFYSHTKDYLDGLEEGRKEKETIIGAMELIKNYCIEITRGTGNCEKCIFCSKGYNGCKLQTSPNCWEPAEGVGNEKGK